MEDQDLYDSLDEDSFFSTSRNSGSNSSPHDSMKNQRTGDNDVIPYYRGGVVRSELDLRKEVTNQRRKFLNDKVVNDKIKKKSYLNIFHAKLGYPTKDNFKEDDSKSNNTSRATCEDLSPKSYTTCEDEDGNSFSSQGDSDENSFCFYDNLMHTEEQNKFLKSCSVISSLSNLHSVSEQYLVNQNNKNSTFKKPFQKPIIKVPVLGGLGPDYAKDKLELLRKRQMYGQAASDKNRIKMAECKVLNEIKGKNSQKKKVVDVI